MWRMRLREGQRRSMRSCERGGDMACVAAGGAVMRGGGDERGQRRGTHSWVGRSDVARAAAKGGG